MKQLTDEQLVKEYVATGSDPAFTELVKRHSGMVQAIAAKMVDWDTAKDVSQRVFLTLHKKAAELDGPICEWLRRTAFHFASVISANARSRQNREQESAAVNDRLANGEECNWDAIRPHLESAMHDLNDDDRQIVMLRYYMRLSQREVAGKLGISEGAVESRAFRALERLRDYFARHGISTSTTGLALLLTTNAVQSAPAGLVASILASVAAAKATTAATAVSGAAAAKFLTMSTLKYAAVGASLVGMLGFALFEANQAKQLRVANDRLAQQQALLTAQLDAKDRKLEDLQRQPTAVQSQRPGLEVLRLRREVTALQARLDAAPKEAIQNATQQAWLKRFTNLQLRASAAAEMKIPELGLVIEDDWMDASRKLSETDEGYQKAFSRVRSLVEGNFAKHIHRAVRRRMADSAGQFPTSIEQLLPYFDPPQDPSMLVRWYVVEVKDDDFETTKSGRIIRLTPVNPALDIQWAVDENGPRSALITVTPATEGAQ